MTQGVKQIVSDALGCFLEKCEPVNAMELRRWWRELDGRDRDLVADRVVAEMLAKRRRPTGEVTVYLAGATLGCTDAECKGWRAYARERLEGSARVLDPMCRDYRGVEDANLSAIVETDKAEVDESDVVLVKFEKPSVGTSMEVLHAWERGKTVLVVADPATKVSPWLRYHAHGVFDKLDDAIDAIKALAPRR